MKDALPCRSLRLLLIEGDAHDALLVRTALSAMRDESAASFELIHVLHVSRLSTALQRLAKGGIDAVLMGLSWLDGPGSPASRIVQAEAPTVPLVVLARHEHGLPGCEARQDGAEEYLHKDQIDGCTLSQALHRAIERQHVSRTLKRLEQDTRARDARAVASART